MDRKHTPVDTETDVLMKSARRCTLCFYLSRDLREKIGQIAHLDKDPSNYDEDNLAFMCLEHHTLFDSKTSQHKNYTVKEVKAARARLHEAIAQGHHAGMPVATVSTDAQIIDDQRFFEQRRGLADTDVMKKIWPKAHWEISIRPTEFKDARFRNLAHCEQFMLGNAVQSRRYADCPTVKADAIVEDTAGAWISGELDVPSRFPAPNLERWVLFRSGLFIYRRALVDNPHLGDNNLHFLEVIRIATQVFILASRMARDGILVPEARVCFRLHEIAGTGLYIPDLLGSHWSREKQIDAGRRVAAAELLVREGRDHAMSVATEIYTKFGWTDPPLDELEAEQNRF